MFKKQWEGRQRKSHQDSPLLLRPIVSVDYLLLVRQNKQYRVIFWGPVYGHWFIRAPKIWLFHWKDKMKPFITLRYKLLLIFQHYCFHFGSWWEKVQLLFFILEPKCHLSDCQPHQLERDGQGQSWGADLWHGLLWAKESGPPPSGK